MPIFAAVGPLVTGAAGAGGIAQVAGGVLGAIGGAGGSSTEDQRMLAGELGFERQGREGSQQAFKELGSFVGAGPGEQDVSSSLGAQRGLAELLQTYSQGGYLPSQQDITQQQGLAEQLFAGRRQAVRGAFAEQQQGFAQQAALMGRNPLDPVFRNKLAQEQTRQLGQLGADQSSFAIEQALQQPERRLQFASQRAGLLGGLASQAMANRQALFNLGQQLQTSGQNFRTQTAGSRRTSGGGLQGALQGAVGGIGAGSAIGGILENFGGGSGGRAEGGGIPDPGQYSGPLATPQNTGFSTATLRGFR